MTGIVGSIVMRGRQGIADGRAVMKGGRRSRRTRWRKAFGRIGGGSSSAVCSGASRMQGGRIGGIMMRISVISRSGRETSSAARAAAAGAAAAHRGGRYDARMLMRMLPHRRRGGRRPGGVVPGGGVGADLRRSARDVLVTKFIWKFSLFRGRRRGGVFVCAGMSFGNWRGESGGTAVRARRRTVGGRILFTLKVLVMMMMRWHAATSHVVCDEALMMRHVI